MNGLETVPRKWLCTRNETELLPGTNRYRRPRDRGGRIRRTRERLAASGPQRGVRGRIISSDGDVYHREQLAQNGFVFGDGLVTAEPVIIRSPINKYLLASNSFD